MKKIKLILPAAACSLAALALAIQPVSATVPGVTEAVSVDSSGNYPNNTVQGIASSGDGRYIVFESNATNLVPNDTNNARDIFLRDTVNNTTTRVSIASDGAQANSDSFGEDVSYDGRYVVYSSYASNLVSNDTNGKYDIFMYDTQNHTTTRVTQTSGGTQANAASSYPVVSADGRFVAFDSEAFNLDSSITTDPNQQPAGQQVFVKDMATGAINDVSNVAGVRINGMAFVSSISCDGGIIGFSSKASNLTPNDTNGYEDAFIANRVNGSNIITNLTANGNGDSGTTAVSCNGNQVLIGSSANNLVSGDTNGYLDGFVYDRLSQSLKRVSLTSTGSEANAAVNPVGISDDGRFIAIASSATNMVPSYPSTASGAVYIKDMRDGTLQAVNIKSDGTIANGSVGLTAMSADGQYISYLTSTTDLISGISNPYGYMWAYQSKTGF